MSDREDALDDEAHQEEEKFDDSSEEDEDEDQDKFEEDDFIVDDVPDGEEEDDDPGPMRRFQDIDDIAKKKKKKRRRYREDSPELAEGDLQLLEEKGVRIDRKKKLKRLRKGASDEEDNALDDVRDLGEEDDEDNYAERRRQADEPVDYDDDMDDFIDDGGRARRRRAAERDGLISSEAVRQARSIFGDIEEMTQYRGTNKLFQKGDGDGDDEDDADYVADGEEGDKASHLMRDRDRADIDNDEDMPPERPRGDEETVAMQLGTPADDTADVEAIVSADVPEQLQYHFGPDYKTPTEAELRDEAAWIYKHGFLNHPAFRDHEMYKSDSVTSKIVVVLSYMHIDKLDIPFIAMYRKDYITPYLIPAAAEISRTEPTEDAYKSAGIMKPPRGFNSFAYDGFRPGISFEDQCGVPRGYDDGFGDWSLLWHILDLDKRYALMLRARKQLLAAAAQAADTGVPSPVIDQVRTVAEGSDDEQQLKDAEHYLRLAVELANAMRQASNALNEYGDEKDESRTRRPSRRKNRYSDFCKRGYRPLSEEFGLSAHQFGENFRRAVDFGEGVQVHEPLDADDEPLHVARLYADRLGEDAERIGATEEKLARRLLGAARFILVTEIVAELQVVKTAREILRKRGTVRISTLPTRHGVSQVDETHPLRFVTSMGERPVETFEDTTDFALVLRAVELGFTKLEVVMQHEQVMAFENLLRSSFVVPVASSLMVERWNEERVLVVEDVKKNLIQRMKEEVKEELTVKTNSVLRNRLTQAFSRKFLLGPGRPNPRDDGCPRVLAVCVTGEDDEEPDPLQVAKDADSKNNGQMNSDRRVVRERITFVEVDENGDYQDAYELFAGWLRRPMGPRDSAQAKLPQPVVDQLKSIISATRPHMIVIGIGSGGRTVIRLQEDLMAVVADMICNNNDEEDRRRKPFNLNPSQVDAVQRARAEASEQPSFGGSKPLHNILSKYIVLTDEFPARIYAKTSFASVGLSMDAMTLLEKRGIALARLAQEPLWVYCAIGQEREAAIHFKQHPYHYFAKPADRTIALDRALFRSVCATGVDINRMLRLPHTQPLLAYVGGLGVHKGKALLRALEASLSEEDRGLLSRKQLWSQNYLGRIVFLSTAAFLRVRDPELHPGGNTRRAVEVRRSRLSRKSRGRRRDEDGGGIYDPMDDSRIHPEHYAVAIKIADEALRDDEGNLRVDLGDSDEVHESLRMTSAVLDDPSGLERLALDEYADHLEKLRRGSLFETVKVIAAEFRGPYRDYRRALTSPEPLALFYLVTGADPLMMRIGSAVTATNCRIRDKKDGRIVGVSCFLPNDVRGFIPYVHFAEQDLSDEAFRQLVPEGSSMTCRVLSFTYDRFEATLTSKAGLIENPEKIEGYISLVDKGDPAYRPYPKFAVEQPAGTRLLNLKPSEEPEKRLNDKIRQTISSLRSHAKTIVAHPYFKEITGSDALGLLQGMLPGDIIIRPSQYSKEGIVFSCKFASFDNGHDKGVFHKDCQVEYDPSNDAVPTRLKLDDVIFEHVDQVIEMHLMPIISNLTECLNHRKFNAGKEKELEKLISEQKRNAPKSIPYCFGLSERSATSLVLVFIPGTTTVQKETIRVVPDGYLLRGVLHKNMNVLFVWFKKNMRKLLPGRRPTTAREPVPASPFQSSFTAAASPFRPAASPYHGARSPFGAARSPFTGGNRSPFTGSRSPFTGGSAKPAQDAPPPPAPVNMSDPYANVTSNPSQRSNYVNTQRSQNADDWSRAIPQRDDPPPRGMQNGGYDRHQQSSPRRRGEGMRGNGQAGPPRGPPPGDDGRMPTWRGAKPVPAWKKKADAEQQANH